MVEQLDKNMNKYEQLLHHTQKMNDRPKGKKMKMCWQMFLAALFLKVVIKRRSIYIQTVKYCIVKTKVNY